MDADGNAAKVAGAAGVGNNVLLTGATGFIGSEILKRILQRHPHGRLSLLVRSNQRETARARVDKLLSRTFGPEEAKRHGERVDVVEGDISRPGLGIDSELSGRLRPLIDHVIHCAATIRFDLSLQEARRHNTEGTRNVLAFAEQLPHLGRLDYVGTAFVAGNRRGLIRESELDVGQGFSNSYEQTKMEAEKLVREFATRRPAAIYRPSVVVGNSKTGETSTFQGFYQVLLAYKRLYTRRLAVVLPFDPNMPVDLVPIDYVIDALFALMHTAKSIGQTFHLASGPGYTCTADELIRMVADFTGIPLPPYVSKRAWRLVVRPLLVAYAFVSSDSRTETARKLEETYWAYAWSNRIFDKTNTNAVLNGTGITTPHARTYFRKILEYQAKALKI
jgi:thioester reductase-like protein